jgi:hypothetical protein
MNERMPDRDVRPIAGRATLQQERLTDAANVMKI